MGENKTTLAGNTKPSSNMGTGFIWSLTTNDYKSLVTQHDVQETQGMIPESEGEESEIDLQGTDAGI